MSGAAVDAPQHVVRITHDPESHTIEDCHDDCEAKVVCLGVTDACRSWWECGRCMKVLNRLGQDGVLNYDERLYERGEAHGVAHEHIDGMWMTPTEMCLSRAAEEDDAYFLIPDLPDGDHPVSIEYEEGYLSVRPLQGVTS